MTLSRKRIDVTISLGTGQFGDTGANTVTITGARVFADIQEYGGDSQPQAQVRIFGQPLDRINQLTAVGPVNAAIRSRNGLIVAAGDDFSMQTLFTGTIDQAWGEFQSMPEVPLNVTAIAGLSAALQPVGALSYPGSADVATIMQTLADTMGLAFENNGVNVQLSNPYFPGTAVAQVRACARAADIRYSIGRDVLAIWPKDGVRAGDEVLISPETGMIGYPSFTSNGIFVTTLMNPLVRMGGSIRVQSSLQVACGKWKVTGVFHALQSEAPGGQWFTQILGVPYYE